ncbi:YitT family protein [Alicyclobacillus sp. SO9]|uniref:YitT family protein n=1 Tax=Alicyclobacillus sp. SO9 TaxID=2665646 RepID=UPI0018E78EE1|nr:YitT family protein [Alicyclobacillus sp. SO9]QQE76959.1 YitT family protein [Alicyclobacillus sp. SO9]
MTKTIIYEVIGIAFGTFITALGINALIVPGRLLTSGVTGVAILIQHFVPVSLAVMYLILNLPLLVLSAFQIGRKFTVYTVYSAILLFVFLTTIHVHHIPTHNILLDSVFGGVLSGGGCAIVLRLGGSQGGLDIVTRVIARHRNVTVANLNLIFNAVIIVLSVFLFNIQVAMYTLISIFASSKAYAVLLNHVGRVSVIIITEHGERVSRAITANMIRGVTSWNAVGTYSNHPKNVLLCVTTNVQLTQLRTIVLENDSKAFISVIATQNVIGHFKQIW